MWNLIGCRRWLDNKLIGLVEELQCLLLVNGYTERPFGGRRIHYIATPSAVGWRSVKCVDLSFTCFGWPGTDAVALLLVQIPSIIYSSVLYVGAPGTPALLRGSSGLSYCIESIPQTSSHFSCLFLSLLTNPWEPEEPTVQQLRRW